MDALVAGIRRVSVSAPRSQTRGSSTYCAFGLEVGTQLSLPGQWRALPGEGRPLVLETAAPGEVQAAFSGTPRPGWEGLLEGRRFLVEHGAEGDLRMALEGLAEFHLAADGRRLLAAADDLASATFLRVLLDSVLFTTALAAGHEALHAGAVARRGQVIAIAGATGAGKSSLARALLAEGATFFSDDVLVVDRRDGGVVAFPGPPVMTTTGDDLPGRLIAQVGEEAWTEVAGASGAAPLACVVLLQPAAAPARPLVLDLLSRMLRFPRTREREAARFYLAGELAAKVPAIAVATRSEPPERLARRVLGRLDVESRS